MGGRPMTSTTRILLSVVDVIQLKSFADYARRHGHGPWRQAELARHYSIRVDWNREHFNGRLVAPHRSHVSAQRFCSKVVALSRIKPIPPREPEDHS